MPARRLDGGDHEQVPGECEVKWLTAVRSQPISVVTEEFSVDISSWPIANSELLDEGGVCGKVDNRSTSAASFEEALGRRDGNGFGNPMFSRVSYQGTGTSAAINTQISSSIVTVVSVTSISGAPNDPTLDTVGYGRTFYTSLVRLTDATATDTSRSFVFPLLFHDTAGCLGETADAIDVYGSAVLQYANFLGGNVTSEPAANDRRDTVVILERDNAILLGREAFDEYLNIQARCDVATEPVWMEEAGYAMCSELPRLDVLGGDLVVLQAVPNVTTVVDGCPLSVLPARFMAVGDFVNGTFDSRLSQWQQDFNRVQTRVILDVLDAVTTTYTVTSPFIQSSTQIGFALPDANDEKEWVLVLAVAVESLLVVLGALVSLIFALWGSGFTPRIFTAMTGRVTAHILGSVYVLAAFLALGIYPVFIGWRSEEEAAEMAQNDVHTRTSLTSVCGAATWQRDDVGLGQWCTSLRTGSETLLVRSYTSTYEGRYAALAFASAVLGGLILLAYATVRVKYRDS